MDPSASSGKTRPHGQGQHLALMSAPAGLCAAVLTTGFPDTSPGPAVANVLDLCCDEQVLSAPWAGQYGLASTQPSLNASAAVAGML